MNEQVTMFIKKKLICLFFIQLGEILVNRFFKMIFLAVWSENILQCPKTQFLGLLYIYTFPIASFTLFVQLTDLGSKKPLQLAHSGYQDTKIFGTRVWGGSLNLLDGFCYNMTRQSPEDTRNILIGLDLDIHCIGSPP